MKARRHILVDTELWEYLRAAGGGSASAGIEKLAERAGPVRAYRSWQQGMLFRDAEGNVILPRHKNLSAAQFRAGKQGVVYVYDMIHGGANVVPDETWEYNEEDGWIQTDRKPCLKCGGLDCACRSSVSVSAVGCSKCGTPLIPSDREGELWCGECETYIPVAGAEQESE